MKNNSILEQFFKHDPNDPNYKQVEFRMRVAANIDDMMKFRGVKKLQLARKMEVQPSVITRWLSGCHNFTIDTLVDIAHALDVTVYKLVEKRKPPVSIPINIFTIAC